MQKCGQEQEKGFQAFTALIKACIPTLVLLILWQLAFLSGKWSAYVLPGPGKVWSSFLTMLGNGTEQSYIDTMQTTANAGIFIAMFAALLVTASISAFVGCKMLKKQFEKAGITA